jgi:hypothetical protein
MKRNVAALGLSIGVLASGLSLSAHHSFAAQFDRDKPITLKGSVTRMEWANPHVYFYMDVADAKGTVANWAVEGQAPSVLYRAGFRKDSAKYGDIVTVEGYLARDGSRLVNMARATLADGRSLFVGVQLPPK